MASISIRIDKTTKTIGSRIDDRLITDEMSEKITEICNLLFDDSNEFKEEKAFAKITQNKFQIFWVRLFPTLKRL